MWFDKDKKRAQELKKTLEADIVSLDLDMHELEKLNEEEIKSVCNSTYINKLYGFLQKYRK